MLILDTSERCIFQSNCKKWKAHVKIILRDSYNSRRTGFLRSLLSRSYEAAHYLQRRHGYKPFDVYLEWDDEFDGEFDLLELPGVGGSL